MHTCHTRPHHPSLNTVDSVLLRSVVPMCHETCIEHVQGLADILRTLFMLKGVTRSGEKASHTWAAQGARKQESAHSSSSRDLVIMLSAIHWAVVVARHKNYYHSLVRYTSR